MGGEQGGYNDDNCLLANVAINSYLFFGQFFFIFDSTFENCVSLAI